MTTLAWIVALVLIAVGLDPWLAPRDADGPLVDLFHDRQERQEFRERMAQQQERARQEKAA